MKPIIFAVQGDSLFFCCFSEQLLLLLLLQQVLLIGCIEHLQQPEIIRKEICL